jgi:hypothetical protein
VSREVVVRYTTRADAAEENQLLVKQVFAELMEDGPDGLRYAVFRLADGVTFVHVAIFDGEDNPLKQTTAFAEFQREVTKRCVEPPVSAEATLVGSYRMITR